MSKLNIEAELNGPQLQAVNTLEGPVLILAGAGSGKTRVITYRIARMLEKGIPQMAILALTFTNKAAREMETRVKDLTGKKLQNLTVSTFHSFGLKILREEAELLDLRKNFSVYDEVDRQSLIKESLRECHKASLKADLYVLGQIFSGIKTGLLDWRGNASEIADLSGRNDWEPVYEAYQQGLRVYNSVDFDDLLTLPLELFEKYPEVLESFRERFRYIMVDEFQDTSLVQYRLVKMLARGGGANSAGPRNICVVGDDDQSIYSWRGANYENILLFEKDFPGVTEIKLEQNYRSTTTILEAANGVISHNTRRKEKTLWSGRDGGKPIELFYPENESAEADFIASQIRHLSIMESRKYQDFGILTRTNSLARNIEEAFLAADIPYKVSGGTSFFQRREIKDILSYLRVIANPDDDVNLLRIINTPRRGIGRTTVAGLGDFAKRNHTSLWNALERLRYAQSGGQQGLFQDKHIHNDLEDFMNQIEFFRREILERKSAPGARWALSQKVRSLTDSIDYWSYLVAEHNRDEKKARWKFANIEYFIRMIENWEKDPDNLDAGLYPWLNRISLITRDDGEDDNEGKANIMTIHAAKGLEFPVVFIAGAEKDLIPHEKSLSEGGDEAGSVEEERRLFYVALTRAREKLYITSCQKRRKLRETLDRAPSPFLEEIPKHLVEYHKPETTGEDPAEADEIFARIMARLK
ncbi:MAG: UvrD-helicase domain-containing protein [Treponema sp.]|nr:UvrD-helicase domain-containing protein [Treponema sp.]